MYYAITFIVGVAVGFVGCWIFKSQAVQTLKNQLEEAKRLIGG
jgi:hypothetical protein